MGQPEITFRNGVCGVSIFSNEIVKNGLPLTVKKAVFSRSFRDKEGNWKDSNSLDINDIPKAIVVLSKAYDYLTSKRVQSTTAQ